jgi:cellulose synthase/poly-beta-1,6-N-acetylglucosamine synthase-like glycosyltransferase
MDFVNILFIVLQVIIGYNLIVPFIFLIWWKLQSAKNPTLQFKPIETDYAIIVTAYEQTQMLPSVVSSLLKLNYQKYIIYIVADNCDVTELNFSSVKVVLLRPETILASNTRSHEYAIKSFIRNHDRLTIIDSDNLVHPEYLNQLNLRFNEGYEAVQGYRAPKNLDSNIACLDAARDIYYHFYDGKILFEIGSSATLSGSGMAFTTAIYRRFLETNNVSGAGFDKVLQSWLILNDYRISFQPSAILYDEKTSKSNQLVQQRSRWINTWFKYFFLGINILSTGISGFDRNKVLFGLVLIRPPLFIFLLLSLMFLFFNLLLGFSFSVVAWISAFAIFIFSFWISLKLSKADVRIYKSLINIPKFMFYQLLSLMNIRKANKISVATRHYHETSDDQ